MQLTKSKLLLIQRLVVTLSPLKIWRSVSFDFIHQRIFLVLGWMLNDSLFHNCFTLWAKVIAIRYTWDGLGHQATCPWSPPPPGPPILGHNKPAKKSYCQKQTFLLRFKLYFFFKLLIVIVAYLTFLKLLSKVPLETIFGLETVNTSTYYDLRL